MKNYESVRGVIEELDRKECERDVYPTPWCEIIELRDFAREALVLLAEYEEAIFELLPELQTRERSDHAVLAVKTLHTVGLTDNEIKLYLRGEIL